MDETMTTTTTGAASSAPVTNTESTNTSPGAPSAPVASSEPQGGTTTPAASETSVATPKPADSEGKVVASGKPDGGGDGFVLVEGPDGRRTLKAAKAQPAAVEAKPAQTEEVPQATEGLTETAPIEANAQAAEEKPEPYTLDEFSAALASGSIDEGRVPEAYQSQYADFKIAQAVKEFNKRAEAQAAKQAEVTKQLSPEEKQTQMKEFFSNLEKEAERRAAQSAGMTEEDLENVEYMDEDDEKLKNYKLAKEWHKQELMQGLQQRAAQETSAREKQRAVYQGITAFVDKAKAEEPNFAAIDKMLPERYKTLPYAEGHKVEQVLIALNTGTITDAQAETLRDYYEATRKEYYAKKNGLSTKPKAAPKPPIVESAGEGSASGPRYTPDYSSLAKAGVRGRRAWLAEYLRNKT